MKGIHEGQHSPQPTPITSEKFTLCAWDQTLLRLKSSFMEITEKAEGEILVLSVTGEIDLNQSPSLRSTLRAKAAAKAPCLLLDFSAVVYIDSSGLATLIEYYQSSRAYSGKLALCSLAPRVRSSFDLVRLSEVFTIYPDRTAALQALRSPSA